MKNCVIFGFVGVTRDFAGRNAERWSKWRPTVSLCQYEELLVNRMELFHENSISNVTTIVTEDIKNVSPETGIVNHILDIHEAWDFEEVYGRLYDFAINYPFDTDKEEYLIHITTGTHVEQICLFLLCESHYFPAKLIQSSPPSRKSDNMVGSYRIIDLDLSRYEQIAKRMLKQKSDSLDFLKSGIATKNPAFNTMIEQIEKVSLHSTDPILLTGPTGSGKSKLARRIFELKKSKRQLGGQLVEVNCATLIGDNAMSTLFGHVKGAFTGAIQNREGLLKKADGSMLFLDEIAELKLDEQAMLLHAIEDKKFMPLGADRESKSNFQLIAGTNKNLREEVQCGRFREDLLARIDLWTYELPSLKDRPEDIEPNIDYEFEGIIKEKDEKIVFHADARNHFLRFAQSTEALWKANFRDLNSAIKRMATFAKNGFITKKVVDEEIERLKLSWYGVHTRSNESYAYLENYLSKLEIDEMDEFDKIQLNAVLEICEHSISLSDAGRKLFSKSRLKMKSKNDSDRLRKYLLKFGIENKIVGHK